MFLEAGGNFIDTSVNYTDGESESFLGEFIQNGRDALVIATKYSLTRPDSVDPNSGGNSRKNMVQSVERSLIRLKRFCLAFQLVALRSQRRQDLALQLFQFCLKPLPVGMMSSF